MKILRKVSENEVIIIFLKGELQSSRFKEGILKIFKEEAIDKKIIEQPNIKSQQENDSRRSIMAKFRGFGENRLLFESFPKEVKWNEAFLNSDEFKKIKYIRWDYWINLTKGSRLPIDAAKRIISKELDSKEINNFKKAAKDLKERKSFPVMILVAIDKKSPLVVLEGHLRLTAYMLAPEYIPEEIKVIIGFSKDFHKWDLY